MSLWLLLWILVWTISGLCPHGHRQVEGQTRGLAGAGKGSFSLGPGRGSLGSLAGMALFRHKTRHWSFRIGMPAILILQVVGLLLWSWRGVWFP